MKKKISVAAILFLLITSSVLAQRNNYSMLLGRRFDIISRNASDVMASLPTSGRLPQWGQTQKPVSARLLKLEILADYRDRLDGVIHYQSKEDAVVEIWYNDKEGNMISDIPAVQVQIGRGEGVAEFSLAIDPAIEDNFNLSTYNLIMVIHNKSNLPKYYQSYVYKDWYIPIDNSKIVITCNATKSNSSGAYKMEDSSGYRNYLKMCNKFKSINDLTELHNPTEPSSNINFGLASAPRVIIQESADIDSDIPTNTSPDQNTASKDVPKGFGSSMTDIFSNVVKKDETTLKWENIDLETMYLDQNSESKCFYYAPRSYRLKVDSVNGYSMTVKINNAEDMNSDNIVVGFTLTNGLPVEEELLHCIKYFAVKNKLPVKSIKPIEAQDAMVSISGGLFSSDDKITIEPVHDINQDINVRWTLKYSKYEELMEYLRSGGVVRGTVLIKGKSNSLKIPVEIALNSYSSLGKLYIERDMQNGSIEYRNQLPFPITVQRLNFERIEPNLNNTKSIRSTYVFNLCDKTVPDGALLDIKTGNIPKYLLEASQGIKAWIEYEPILEQAALDKALANVISTANESKRKMINVETLGVLEKYKADKAVITFRSKQLDPKNKSVHVTAVSITDDGNSYEVGPFYLWDVQNLNYDYDIELFSDSDSHSSINRIKENKPELFINQSTAKSLIGY